MGEVFFVIKTFIITFVFVLILQVKIGEQTLDQRIHTSIQASKLVAPIEETVRGGVLFIEHSYHKVLSLFNTSLKQKINGDHAPGSRFKIPEMKRYTEEMANEVSEKVTAETKKTARRFRDRLSEPEDSN